VVRATMRMCQGAREVVSNKLRLICPVCAGSGIAPLFRCERLDALQVEPATYQAWEPRLRELLLILTERDGAAAAHDRCSYGRKKLDPRLNAGSWAGSARCDGPLRARAS